ncbi:MAG: DUF1501 domain-containing protein [Acidimicrobiia bacterium]
MSNPISDALNHEMSRRRFLGVVGIAGVSTLAVGALSPRFAFATPEDPKTGDVIVHIFLRGGIDGLGVLAPCNNASYKNYRNGSLLKDGTGKDISFTSDLRLNGSDANPVAATDLFLHPEMKPLYDGAWKDTKLAIIPACGIREAVTLSHFEAERMLADGSAKRQPAGLMNRFAGAVNTDRLTAVGVGAAMPLAFEGTGRVFGFTSKPEFAVSGFQNSVSATTALKSLYSTNSTAVSDMGGKTIDVVNDVQTKVPAYVSPALGTLYRKGGSLGAQLKQTADLIRANVGLRSVGITLGGWDTHAVDVAALDQTIDGVKTSRLSRLANALQAFYQDLGQGMNEVTVLVVSEFGRTVKVNESGGTDHGRGTVMMVMGGKVNGGIRGGYPADWTKLPMPGSERSDAIPVLTDFRTVMAEVLVRRGGVSTETLSSILPTYDNKPAWLGVVNY